VPARLSDGKREPAGWRLRRLVATHPPLARRFTELRRVDRWESGFAVAFTIGLLAMFTFQTLRLLSVGAGGPTLLPTGAAAIVWAGISVPLWASRPDPRRRRWWARVLGSAAGLLAGYLLPTVGDIAPVYGFFLAGFLAGALGCAIVAALGFSALAAGLAEAVAKVSGAPRRTLATVCCVLGVAGAFTAVLEAAHLAMYSHYLRGSVAGDRILFSTPTGLLPKAALTALVTAAAVTVVLGARRAWRGPVLIAAVAVTVAAPAIALFTEHVLPRDDEYFLLHNRWLLCAAAGWLVTVLLLVARGAAGTATAVLAGFGTASASALLQVLWEIRAGAGPTWAGHLVGFQERTLWLLLPPAVAAAPVAVLLHDGFAALGRAAAPGRIGWRGALVTGPAVVAVTAVVALGWTAPVTGEAGDAGLAGADQAERLLSTDEVREVLAAAHHNLPSAWTEQQVGPRVVAGVLPTACAELFAANLDANLAADPAVTPAADRLAPASGTLALALPADGLPPLGATLTMTLTSLPEPDAALRAVARSRAEVASCPRWTEPMPLADDRVGHFWAVAMPSPADLPYPSFRSRLTVSTALDGLPGVVGGARIVVAAGHNVVTAEIVYGRPYQAFLEPADQLLLDTLAVTAAKLIIEVLDP
jgi:hypothetical protein